MSRPDAWTPAQDTLLRSLWTDPGVTRDQIARKLGRTLDACRSRAHYLGLRGASHRRRRPAIIPPMCSWCGARIQAQQLRDLDGAQLMALRDAVEVEMRTRAQSRLGTGTGGRRP